LRICNSYYLAGAKRFQYFSIHKKNKICGKVNFNFSALENFLNILRGICKSFMSKSAGIVKRSPSLKPGLTD